MQTKRMRDRISIIAIIMMITLAGGVRAELR
jgi:hypothetical protein